MRPGGEIIFPQGNKKGWIRVYRGILKKSWFKNHKVVKLWFYCQLKATHQPIKAMVGYRRVPLKPGQFIFGRKKAAEETGLSEREIRTCIKFLARNGTLTINPVPNKFSIITIVNWEKYQSIHSQSDHREDQQVTNKRPHTRSKEEEDKEHLRSAPEPRGGEFLSFWDQSFQKKYGIPYGANSEKDKRLIKKLLKKHSLEQLQVAGRIFFNSRDPAIQNSGHTIEAFYSRRKKLITQGGER